VKLSKGLKYLKGTNFAASSMGRRSLSEMGGPCSCASAAPEAGVQAADIVAGQDASTPSALLVNLFP